MGKKISVYLTDEALENLSEVRGYLEHLTGCTLSRSAALNSLLVKGAGLFVADQKNARRVVAKYTERPLMLEALRIAREEGHNERGD